MLWQNSPQYIDLSQINRGKQFTGEALTHEIMNAIVHDLQFLKIKR